MLNEVGSLFGMLKYVCDIVVKKFTFAISSPDEFLYLFCPNTNRNVSVRPIVTGINSNSINKKHCGVDAAITAVYSHLLLLILINAKYE